MSRNRVTGMYSGLDTESLISQLVEAKSVKVNNTKKEQMTLTYKQDAWKELNSKVKSLFNTANNMRFQSAYAKKITSVSDSSVASVVTSDTAMNAVQSLKVNKLAKTAYMTGGEIDTKGTSLDGAKATSGTKLTALGIEAGSKINISIDGKDNEIEITDKTTLGDLASKLSSNGVTANFDASTQRLFIGAKDTGAKYDFTISSSNDSGASALAKLGLIEKPETGADPNINYATRIKGSDAEIELNGAKFTSSTNTFDINGLTITAKAETTGEGVTLSTTKDTSAMYDMIKKFINEYSTLINEMDKLYNTKADSTYKPLTDEEKAAMSDFEIEKWEEKLKEQALSKDENLNSLSSTLKMVMSSGIEVGGKTMNLFDFGIETAGYFTAADNEKNAYHIYGDKDDEMFANETNKLEEMISKDPDAVEEFFYKLNRELYSKMDSMSAKVNNVRSYGSFYDDQKLKSDYEDYTTKIEDLEAKLADYEDKWYDKFGAMETAMAKMQSNQNAISSLLGMN